MILLIATFLTAGIKLFIDEPQSPDLYVGVEVAYGRFSECRELVDKVKNYTNLFVIGSLEVTLNRTLLDSVCNYLYEAGMYFIVQFTSPVKYSYDPCKWILEAQKNYGEKFLGVYYFDEPGGRQLDKNESRFVISAENFTDAAKTYIEYLYAHAKDYLSTGVRLFTADYGLYWFDYKAGYHVILSEFGWNHSRELQIALCRGAANVQQKDWGVIITWTYWNPPYIESGEELYKDMVLAYHAGTKYIVIFNYGLETTSKYGILTDEHFEAIKKFWKYVNQNPKMQGIQKANLAYILPNDYGFGFRKTNDTIWGLWTSDEHAMKIWNQTNALLNEHGLSLDIVYDDPEFRRITDVKYKKLIFWNETAT